MTATADGFRPGARRGLDACASPRGIFGVYSMREVFEYTKFWAVGTGREFALGAMHSQYQRMRNATAVATAGIDASASMAATRSPNAAG